MSVAIAREERRKGVSMKIVRRLVPVFIVIFVVCYPIIASGSGVLTDDEAASVQGGCSTMHCQTNWVCKFSDPGVHTSPACTEDSNNHYCYGPGSEMPCNEYVNPPDQTKARCLNASGTWGPCYQHATTLECDRWTCHRRC